MKKLIYILSMLISSSALAQESQIPECFREMIQENPECQGLYLAEIEGDTLYHIQMPPPKGADMITVALFYDSNCRQVNSSASGGFTGRPKGYKPYTIVKALWQKEVYPVKELRSKKHQFELITNYYKGTQFRFADHQLLYFSAQDGLQLINNGKITRTYKTIFKQPVHYHRTAGISQPSDDLPANAWRLDYDGQTWILTATKKEDFSLLPTDENGIFNPTDGWIDLKLKK